MKTVLIAVKSEELTEALFEQLQTNYQVHTCHQGDHALYLLDTLRPDILIIDLSLPYIDGLTVLQTTAHKPTTILALTNIANDSILHAAANAGVKHLFLIPCRAGDITEKIISFP